MKKIFVLALSAMMLAAFAVPSFAKVNLSGAMWVTYWAQQEGIVLYDIADGATWRSSATVNNTGVSAGMGGTQQQAKKTFLVGQSMTGSGVNGQNPQGYGFELVADCPVNDWVKAYGDFNVVNNGNLGLVEGYINLAFMKELNVRAGRMQVPFGLERTTRPVAGQEEVFVSDYTQQANGSLQRQYDVGVQAFGTVASGMVDYSLFMGNGAINSVSMQDTSINRANNVATPDQNDAKQYGLSVNFRPFTGAFVGGSYFGGDVTNTNVSGLRSKFTAYDVNAGYEYGNIFALSAEYATSRYDKAGLDFQLATATPQSQLTQNRVNEYILKAIYTGVADWEFGVRYGVVDPKNSEAEQDAGLSMEKKLSFAAGYKFARAAFLKAEYSWIDTNYEWTSRISPVAARIRQSPNDDVDDDIFALSLGLQF